MSCNKAIITDKIENQIYNLWICLIIIQCIFIQVNIMNKKEIFVSSPPSLWEKILDPRLKMEPNKWILISFTGKTYSHEFAWNSCEFHANSTHEKETKNKHTNIARRKRTIYMRYTYECMRIPCDYHAKSFAHDIYA